MEPKNKEDEYAVAEIEKKCRIVGHLSKGTSGKPFLSMQ